MKLKNLYKNVYSDHVINVFYFRLYMYILG